MSAEFNFGGEVVWGPSPEIIEHANLTRFMRQNGIATFEALLERSGRDIEWFTQALIEFLQIRFRVPYEKVVDQSRGIAWPRWCPGGVMHIIDNCLDQHLGTPAASRTE